MPMDLLAKTMLPVGAHPSGPPLQPESRRTNVVLLVDDHDLVRATTAETLAELGYRVVEAGSGEEALRLLEDGLCVDLMVTDLVMPGIGGAELAALARSRWPGLPILLVSGHSDPDGAPADLPCLTKPYRRTALADHLAALRRPIREPTD